MAHASALAAAAATLLVAMLLLVTHQPRATLLARPVRRAAQHARQQMLSEVLPPGVPAGVHPGDGPAPSWADAAAWARGHIKPAGMAPGPWKTTWRAVKDEDRHLGVPSVKSTTPTMPDNIF